MAYKRQHLQGLHRLCSCTLYLVSILFLTSCGKDTLRTEVVGVRRKFPGGQSRHLAYPFHVLTMHHKLKCTKPFTVSTPQRKWPILRQQLHAMLSLYENFTTEQMFVLVSINILRPS